MPLLQAARTRCNILSLITAGFSGTKNTEQSKQRFLGPCSKYYATAATHRLPSSACVALILSASHCLSCTMQSHDFKVTHMPATQFGRHPICSCKYPMLSTAKQVWVFPNFATHLAMVSEEELMNFLPDKICGRMQSSTPTKITRMNTLIIYHSFIILSRLLL